MVEEIVPLEDDLHAREASMSLTADVYNAVLGANQPAEQFIAFKVNPGGPPDTPLRYRFGAIAYGRFGGVIGNGGMVHFTRILNNYTDSVGVHGTARDFGGVAGTSLNRVGVYGQLGGGEPVPVGVHAGVIGAASTQPGVIGWSREGYGVQGTTYMGMAAVRGESFGGLGVYGISQIQSGITGVAGGEGPPLPDPAIAGVVDTSAVRGHGVIGTSITEAGVVGYSTEQMGVYGETGATGPNSSAGYFKGNVIVTGTLTEQPADHRGAVPRRYAARALLHGEPRTLVRRFRHGEAQARARGGQARCGLRQSDQARRLSRVPGAGGRLPRTLCAP
jgi:hypothetical protein